MYNTLKNLTRLKKLTLHITNEDIVGSLSRSVGFLMCLTKISVEVSRVQSSEQDVIHLMNELQNNVMLKKLSLELSLISYQQILN